MFQLPDLPYAYDALGPVVSAETMRFHHDKHHATYVKTLNELLAKSGAQYATLEEVVTAAAAAEQAKVFNNAAQAWNHAFFWESMSPAHEKPTGELQAAIAAAFGDLAGLQTAFVTEGAGHFGSGWVWLASDQEGKLGVFSTHDAGGPLTEPALTPLLVCDVWEHAYYIDHRNDRKAYLEAWFDALPNWGFAAAQLTASRSNGRKWAYPVPSAAS
jgi:Fe-Mn family superoxide dismutase